MSKAISNLRQLPQVMRFAGENIDWCFVVSSVCTRWSLAHSQVVRRYRGLTGLARLDIPDTPVEEPARDPNAPTREDNGDRSPKPDRPNPRNDQDPNQLPKSPKRAR